MRHALLHLAQAPLHWPAAQSTDLAERKLLEGMPIAMRPACFAQPLELQALQATKAFSSVVTSGEVPVHEATERLASELLQDATLRALAAPAPDHTAGLGPAGPRHEQAGGA